MKGPLKGIRVLDASMGAVGPWTGVLLGMLGADVIKLESPQGDFIRTVMPSKKGLSVTYVSMNFNKHGVVLDLKNADDLKMAHDLAAEADVFIENFRPGVADRIGVGYDTLAALNPKLIYASASGFGRSGPMVKIGATDPHIQPFTGSCSVNGMPGGKLQRWRWYGHFDCTTAMCICEGILSALLERDTTGRGKLVLVTMIEAAMALQRVRISEHLAGATPKPMGSAVSYLVPDQAFDTKDRPLAVTAGSRREWRALCEAIERPELAEDPRFARNPDRVKNRATLIPLLQEAFAKYSAGFWLDRLRQKKVPAALFTSFDEFRDNRHYLDNKMLTTFDTPHWGELTVGGVPWRFEKTPGEVRPGTPPGADTERVKARGWAGIGA
jgi:crotonobetainyl-CoA:carnitine CoA-transferase CaiB-like acyl-CoA transferase